MHTFTLAISPYLFPSSPPAAHLSHQVNNSSLPRMTCAGRVRTRSPTLAIRSRPSASRLVAISCFIGRLTRFAPDFADHVVFLLEHRPWPSRSTSESSALVTGFSRGIRNPVQDRAVEDHRVQCGIHHQRDINIEDVTPRQTGTTELHRRNRYTTTVSSVTHSPVPRPDPSRYRTHRVSHTRSYEPYACLSPRRPERKDNRSLARSAGRTFERRP